MALMYQIIPAGWLAVVLGWIGQKLCHVTTDMQASLTRESLSMFTIATTEIAAAASSTMPTSSACAKDESARNYTTTMIANNVASRTNFTFISFVSLVRFFA
jgi:hypothetical protein